MTTSKRAANRSADARLHRVAERRRFTVTKSGRRDPLAPDYDRWTVRAADGTTWTELTFEQAEAVLDGRWTG